MVRETANAAAATAALHLKQSSAVQKHKKKNKYGDRGPTPVGLVARPAVPKLKHKTIFEWAENTDRKKKKLEIEVTTNRTPPPSFTFIPIGNPELTNICKELSREQGALVYIVSTTKGKSLTDLSDHVHRLGYHFRTQIFEEAISSFEGLDASTFTNVAGQDHIGRDHSRGDPIPDSQEEINRQADAAIRDLFPRIPNTDREMIIQHAFQKGAVFNGKLVVGLQSELTLSRRVQLAVIAHIRHTHTRYDLLLRETAWENARKTVEPLCLDILVKWRGDEETGRDQLDEVLREIVVLDDSDDEEDDEDDDDDDEEESDENTSGDDLEEGEVPEAEPAIREKTPVIELISLISSPTHAPSSQLFVEPTRTRLHESAISTRTRSKTKANKNYSKGKAKKARRRHRAWQAALNRMRQQDSAQNHVNELGSRVNQPNSLQHNAPSNILANSDYSNLPPDLRDRPYNQSIYAIDDRPSRLERSLPPTSQTFSGPSTSNHREQVIVRPRLEHTRMMDQGHGYDHHPMLTRPLQVNEPPRTPGGFLTSPRGHSAQERVLPSIEQSVDIVSERSTVKIPSSPGRRSEVMYSHPEHARVVSSLSNIVYVDDYEPQPKRQRMVLANGESLPIYDDLGDGYLRPLPRQERPPMYGDESSELVRVRQVPVAGYRDEEPPLMSDDGRRLVRIMRRVPAFDTYPREQRSDQHSAYSSHRAEGQLYTPGSRPTPSMRESRPVESIPAGRVAFGEQASATSHRIVPDNFTYLSTFPNHSQSHSREMNSGVVSYPVSHPLETESRFLPTRLESQVGRIQPSPQFSTERFPIGYPDRGTYRHEAVPRKFDGLETNRPQIEQLYVPAEVYGRVGETARPSVQDMTPAPVYRRGIPRRDEVIVLE